MTMSLISFLPLFSDPLPISAVYTTVLLWLLTPEPTVADCEELQIDFPPWEL